MTDGEDAKIDDGAAPTNGARRLGVRLEGGLRAIADVLSAFVDADDRTAPQTDRSVEWHDADADDAASEWTGSDRDARMLRTVTADHYLVDARFEDGAFVVAVDIPDAEVAEVSAGIDPMADQLVIGERDAVVARVDLPWSTPQATGVWFNNGVLEIHLRPADR